jgi:acetylserotonin O-methyltransferase
MNTLPDPAPILDYIEGFRRSKTMFTAVRLGVFDELERQPQSAAQLALKLQLHAGALERLLNGCIVLGLLEKTGSTYRNSTLSSVYLASSSPDSLSGYIVYSDLSLYELWSHLADAVREGSHRWTQTFGSRNTLFDHYFRDEAATASFLGGMHGFGQISSSKVVAAFDLGNFHHLADLGGATGHLAIAACEKYPKLRATVVDLPPVIPYAQARISQSPAASRIETLAADFFADPLPPADLYSLGRILHDWSDDRIQVLLTKIFGALPPGGALLVGERLVDENKCGPRPALMQDLNMLVCTDGRERTFSEYKALLSGIGFDPISAKQTGAPLDALLALKPASATWNPVIPTPIAES